MKWIGLLFLVGCGAAAGNVFSGHLHRQLVRLEKVCSFLREMGVLMQYQMSTLEELLDTFSRRSVYEELHFLPKTLEAMQQQIPFVQAWQDAVTAEQQLPTDASEILLELGGQLGTTDLDGQLSALEQAHVRLQQLQASCRAEYQKKGKLYRSLGLLAGLLLAILFC